MSLSCRTSIIICGVADRSSGEQTARGRSGLEKLPRNVTSKDSRVLEDAIRCFNDALKHVKGTPSAASTIDKARLYQKLSDTSSRLTRVGDLDRGQRETYLKNARDYNTKMIELVEPTEQYPQTRLQAQFERACLVAQEIEFEAQGRVPGYALLELRRRRDAALLELSERLQRLQNANHERVATFQQQEDWYRRHLGSI